MNKAGFDSFYIFQSVMRYGSFTGAAAAEGTTTENVAEEINRLESVLDMALFNPGSGGTVPTAGGLFLYDKLDNLLWNLEAILQQAKAIPPEDNMKLVLGISETMASSFYRKLIREFTKNHPTVELVLKSFWTDLHRSLTEGKFDVALTFSIAYPEGTTLVRQPLTREKPVILYSDKLVPDAPEAVSIDSFCGRPFVCLNTDLAAMDMLKGLPFKPSRVIFTENLKTLQLYVVSGLACTVLSNSQQMAEVEGVHAFENTFVDYTMGTDIVWDRNNRNPAIAILASCAAKVFPPVAAEDFRDPV